MVRADRLSRELAERTGGALSTRAARSVGLCDRLLARRKRDGVWEARTDRVLVLRGAPKTFEQDAWVGLLHGGDGCALSHDTALALWGVPGFSLRPIHVSRTRDLDPSPVDGVVFHRPRLWPGHHRALLNGSLPIATPTRALFDLANERGVHPLKVERAINNAWTRGLTDGARLEAMADEWCRRGRKGSAFLHEYLASHPVSWQPPESNLEARFSEIIVEGGMPRPRRQVDVGGGERWIGRVDVLDPEVPLIGEIDSDRFHGAPLDAESDHERDVRMAAAGFHVVRFTEHEVWHDRDGVVTKWREARRAAVQSHRRSA